MITNISHLTDEQIKAFLTTAETISDDMESIVTSISKCLRDDGCLYSIIDSIDMLKPLLIPFLKTHTDGITCESIYTIDRHIRDAILYRDIYKVKACVEVVSEWIRELKKEFIKEKS